MKIEVNNKIYLKIYIDKTRNALKIETWKKGQVEQTRLIDEVEFVDLYNILVYAQEHNKNIYELWKEQ